MGFQKILKWLKNNNKLYLKLRLSLLIALIFYFSIKKQYKLQDNANQKCN